MESAQTSDIYCLSGPETKKPTYSLVYGLGNLDRNLNGEIISTLTFDKSGKYLSVGDHDGRIVIFTFNDTAEGARVPPQLQFYEEIFAFEPEFQFQDIIEITPKITSIEWLNRGYQGRRPSFLASNEKGVKLFQLKERFDDPSVASDSGTAAPKNVTSA